MLFEYDNEVRPTRESSYNPDGSLFHYKIHLYDESGELIGQEEYNSEGNLVFSSEGGH